MAAVRSAQFLRLADSSASRDGFNLANLSENFEVHKSDSNTLSEDSRKTANALPLTREDPRGTAVQAAGIMTRVFVGCNGQVGRSRCAARFASRSLYVSSLFLPSASLQDHVRHVEAFASNTQASPRASRPDAPRRVLQNGYTLSPGPGSRCIPAIFTPAAAPRKSHGLRELHGIDTIPNHGMR